MSNTSNDESHDTQVVHSESALKTTEKGTLDESQDFPEGGWAGWATVVGAFLVLFSTNGLLNSFGVFQDFYAQQYITSQTSSTIALIGSINAFLCDTCSLLAGKLYDRGYFYPMLYGASFLQVFSLFMLSLAGPDKYYQVFLAQGVGSGIASGFLYIPCMAVISHWFDKRRPNVMAFAASGSYLGAAVHPIMLNNLINGRVGFANGVRASAALIGVLLLIACLLMRTRLKPSESSANFVVATKKCGRDSAFILGCLGLALFLMVMYYPSFYLQLDTVRHNLGNSFSFYSLVIMNTAVFFGQLSCTALVGFLRTPTVLIIGTFCSSVIVFGMIGLHTVAGVVVFALFSGYFSGIVFALWTPTMVLLTPDLSELGVRMGIASVLMAIGGLVGPPISGALLTPAYIWWRGAVFNGIAAAVACALFVAMNRILDRRSGTTTGSSSTSEPGA